MNLFSGCSAVNLFEALLWTAVYFTFVFALLYVIHLRCTPFRIKRLLVTERRLSREIKLMQLYLDRLSRLIENGGAE